MKPLHFFKVPISTSNFQIQTACVYAKELFDTPCALDASQADNGSARLPCMRQPLVGV